jgi:hypothetical protein
MASTNDVIFPEGMEDFLANPVDICFGSKPSEPTAPTTCLVIEGDTVNTDQQIETDQLLDSHPPSSIVLKTCSPTRSKSANASSALLVCGAQLTWHHST